jgi:hypothetical protein
VIKNGVIVNSLNAGQEMTSMKPFQLSPATGHSRELDRYFCGYESLIASSAEAMESRRSSPDPSNIHQ